MRRNHENGNDPNVAGWLLAHLRPYTFTVLGSLVLILGGGFVSTLDPLLMRHMIDYSFPSRHLTDACVYAVLIAACFWARSILVRSGNLLGFRVAQSLGQDLRCEMLEQMTRLSADWHEQSMLGDKVSRFDSDVEQIAEFGSDIAGQVLNAVALLSLNLAIMLRLNVAMTLTLLPLLPLFYVVRRRFRSSMQFLASATQEGIGKAIGNITEHLDGAVQLQLLGATRASVSKSVASWADVMKVQWRQRRTEAMFGISVSGVLALAFLFAPLLAVKEYARGAITVGTIIAFYGYTVRIFEPIASSMELYVRSQRVLASAKRVLEVLEQKPTVPDNGTYDQSFSRLSHSLSVENVDFGYSSHDNVLCDINVTLFPGESVVLAGLSGSGKSSFARLIVRLADPTRGHILIDKRDARDYTLSALRRTVHYLPQTPHLFQGTIRENLLRADPHANEHALETVVAAACLDEVLSKRSDGLDQTLREHAGGLSGGEQQRLAIARALLQDSAVLILDEATSALDAPTEARVLRAIRRLKSETTLIIISHRIKGLQWADRFILLRDGRVTDQGSHAKLYAESHYFRMLSDTDTGTATQNLADPTLSYVDQVETAGQIGNLTNKLVNDGNS